MNHDDDLRQLEEDHRMGVLSDEEFARRKALIADEEYDEPQASRLSPEVRQWAMFAHLSALAGLVVGGFTIVGPLIIWLVKKDESKFIDMHGKESVNFQINVLVYYLIAVVITLVTCGLGFPVLFIPLLYGIIMPIIAGLKANEGKPYEYPATFRLIK
jgi:uncharacterized Tic20 family protein